MDKYENLGVVGEGSYGIVSKVRHKPTLRIVAIKKFIESEDDKNVRKIALREVRALRKLKHDNLVALLEVFRRKKRLYLVFEYVDRTVLDELERSPNGLSDTFTCKIIYQVIKGTQFMHDNSYIHRDIKPENILVSKGGVVKICDFGFARAITASQDLPETGNTKQMGSGRIQCTDYVATRWYRAPELLVGDLYYGKGVDTWAIGCLTAELSNSLPLFPGKSDLDQLHLIMMTCGELCKKTPNNI
jgi:cyclin-dependent kinase-like